VAKQEFLDNVRVGRDLFDHARVEGVGRHLASQSSARRLEPQAIWLTPKSVGGFDVGDFRELGPDRQRELAETVQEFLALTKQVPPAAEPTADQLAQASAVFGKLLTILDPYLPTHEEAIKVEEVLQIMEFPEWVANWYRELGNDWAGDPAVRVTIFVDEPITPRKQLGRFATDYTAKIRHALKAKGIERWPYIQVRGVVEHRSMS
jgi:hypothetical protein